MAIRFKVKMTHLAWSLEILKSSKGLSFNAPGSICQVSRLDRWSF